MFEAVNRGALFIACLNYVILVVIFRFSLSRNINRGDLTFAEANKWSLCVLLFLVSPMFAFGIIQNTGGIVDPFYFIHLPLTNPYVLAAMAFALIYLSTLLILVWLFPGLSRTVQRYVSMNGGTLNILTFKIIATFILGVSAFFLLLARSDILK